MRPDNHSRSLGFLLSKWKWNGVRRGRASPNDGGGLQAYSVAITYPDDARALLSNKLPVGFCGYRCIGTMIPGDQLFDGFSCGA